MKLRSGRQITYGNECEHDDNRLYISTDAMIKSMYIINSDDIKTLHYHDWFLSRIEQTRGILNYIREYSDEKLASIDITPLKI